MVQSVTYQSETKTVHFQGKSIVLESLTPVLSPKEKEKRKEEIERCLYEVFSKYRRASDTVNRNMVYSCEGTWYTTYNLVIRRFISFPSMAENSAILKFR